jgi:hypothetical protein
MATAPKYYCTGDVSGPGFEGNEEIFLGILSSAIFN